MIRGWFNMMHQVCSDVDGLAWIDRINIHREENR